MGIDTGDHHLFLQDISSGGLPAYPLHIMGKLCDGIESLDIHAEQVKNDRDLKIRADNSLSGIPQVLSGIPSILKYAI